MSQMFDPAVYVHPNGRLVIGELRRLVQNHSKMAFTNGFAHPILVGTSLKVGDFKEDYMVNQSTMEFQPDDPDMVGSSLSSAIFPILRRQHTRTTIGEFSIGRTDENDLVMNDFSISKKHALIISSQDGLVVKDLDSRNGVTVDGDFIHPSQPEVIKPGSELGIGRYQFEVVAPDTLYQRVKASL